MAIDMLIQEAKGMSDDAIMEVVRFMRFIKVESKNNDTLSSFHNQGKIRMAGIYKGQGWMADDFDAPLEDFKEYM